MENIQESGAAYQGDPLVQLPGSSNAYARNAKSGNRKRPRQAKQSRPGMQFTRDPLWYKDAVIYQIHVKSYFDANDDGIGDFAGLIQKLDYITGLGVNTIWLLPFYPSPRRDDGYDISEYKNVHPDYGNMSDVRRFIAAAHEHGLRVITELVINHTSDQHPWFQRARRARPGSVARNFYVWSDDDKSYADTRIIFVDTEKSNWTWDPVAKAYFWHRFYSHQPDLNFDNPHVLKAVLNVMSFWLDLGIDGLRLDAVPYLIEREGTSNENLPETHAILKRIRAEMDSKYPDRMLLAEANMWPEDVQQYFGDSDECHMAFHFPLMPRMYMALASQDRFPITDILRQTPDIPADCQWAIFLRNHDELTLEMVTDAERDYLWNHYAPDRRARINLGIRRRLAPLVERDWRRIQLLNSFLLSMPGTPVIYYGDEIGMGDNIHLGDRDGVRTPMQWTPDRNGGFSRVDPARLVLPLLMDPQYGYQTINVEAQSADRHSMLNWMRRLLNVRKQHQAFGRGSLALVYPSNRKIFAYLREFTDPTPGGATETILCVANVSQSAQAVELDLSAFAGRIPIEMMGGAAFPPIGQLNYLLTLPPFGFYWFLLAPEANMPSWRAPTPEPLPEYVTLVLRKGVQEIMEPPARKLLEQEVLPHYLLKRRWYAGKQRQIDKVEMREATTLPMSRTRPGALPIVLTEIDVHSSGTEGDAGAGSVQRYLLPLGFIREEDTVSALPHQLALSRVRRGRNVGFLTDAFALDSFIVAVLELLADSASIKTRSGQLRCIPTAAFDPAILTTALELRRITQEQSNSSVVINNVMMMKVLRQVNPGIHPEIEMGRYLTERGFANVAATLGEVVRVADDGTPYALIVLQRYVDNQGDAWQWSMDTLERAIQSEALDESQRQPNTRPQDAQGIDDNSALVELVTFSRLLGQRLGEMHSLLGQPSDDPAFDPQTIGEPVWRSWAQGAARQLEAALDILRQKEEWPNAAEAHHAARLLAQRERLLERIHPLAQAAEGSLAMRLHGDLHLGQVLIAFNDVYIVDFEGEPARPLEQRRAKGSPLRDVAGLLRSFDYAAAFGHTMGPTDLDEAALASKKQILQRFAPACQAALLEGYRLGNPLLEQSLPLDAQALLLDLFTLEKAAYEICYEAANRPTWMHVPLRGLYLIANRILGEEDGA
ncbi:maltose alpha-D-glucosyltransferase [Herbaspirillum seropedicae]|uniref:maltose alpha-D-glucosyltransferase n=1 Tax=Herbaspirillum seropedicae TaxID=964 RepID=UPI001C60FA29|nr:maltose alpha-D-glucosyltransferase [Herbaspirillum seropedicae]